MTSRDLSDADRYWLLHGHYYDFTDFVSRHPGGSTFISLGKGRDCTELFESVHQLSDVNFKAIMNKYHIGIAGDEAQPQVFSWDPKNAEFLHELRSRVRKYFSQKSHKGSVLYWICYWIFVAATVLMAYTWITQKDCYMLAFASGCLSISYGFFAMHTASHGAISDKSWINWLITVTFCDLTGWIHTLWLQHHVYGHHSYTGIYGRDPDMRNMNPFARKSHQQSHQDQHRYQHYLALPVMLLIPNQYLGQVFAYFQATFRKRLFGMPVVAGITSFDSITAILLLSLWIFCIVILPVYLHGISQLKSVLIFYTGSALTYWSVVIPNHDTEEVLLNSEGTSRKDWAIHQIVHSSNFRQSYFFSQFFGGMNYQIEHHLFPCVHPIHYPSISKIVRGLCQEYNIPYVEHESWFHSFFSHMRLLKLLAQPNPEVNKTD